MYVLCMGHEKLISKAHPAALFWLSAVYAFYAISYGVLFSDLLLYIVHGKAIHLSETYAYHFVATFSTLTFILPIIGGKLCDQFGFKRVALCGLILVLLGLWVLAFNHVDSLSTGVAICLAGNALVLPGVWSMVGLIYDLNDTSREAGSILFYMILNVGFLIAFLCSGWVASQFGYSRMFICFSMGCLISIFILLFYRKNIHLQNVDESFDAPLILLGVWAVVLFVTSWALLYWLSLDDIISWGLMVGVFIYLFQLSKKSTNTEKNNILRFMFLCPLAVIGIIIYNSEFGLMPEFAYHCVNLSIGQFKLSGGMITSLDPLFCIIIGLLLNALWRVLREHNKVPTLFEKLTLGIIFPAVGYLLLALILHVSGASKLSIWILLPLFALFVVGELLVIPTGISISGQLAPVGKQGTFMGIWSVMQGFSALMSGYIAQMTVVNAQTLNLSEINLQYTKVFGISGSLIVFVGVISWVAFRRWSK